MIYVSQGHELGIGLEVFFKSTLSLSQNTLDHFVLYASSKSIGDTLKTLNLPFKIQDSNIVVCGKQLSYCDINADKNETESSKSLLEILKIIKKEDILITLPTSKDQLIHNDENCAGYTEFFRKFYQIDELSMIFKSYDLFVLLLSDHIPLSSVTKKLNRDFISSKIQITLNSIKKYFKLDINEVLISGINPHAGEGGVLGHEDSVISSSIQDLNKIFPKIKLQGPLPGDTLHFHKSDQLKQLFVYAFHDQGLPFFKDKYGLFGINITMGLDFLRMSVDHGTAFSLYGKNQASSSGCLYVLNEAFKIHSNR